MAPNRVVQEPILRVCGCDMFPFEELCSGVGAPLSAPALSSNSTNINRFVSGTYVSLHCDGGNQSIISYTFYQDGKNICSGPNVTCRDSYFYFQPITASDRGNYTCVIQNPASFNTSNTLQLTVSAPVSDVRLTSNASGYLWPGINSTSLTCSALGTEVSYTWSLKGAPLPQDPQYKLTQGNSVLTISPVSANDDGPFTCTASNWMNNATSNGLNISLAYPSLYPVCSGLGGREVAGIVIGVIAGIIIIEVAVYFALKAKKKAPETSTYENENIPPSHIYSTTLPGAEFKAGQESHYDVPQLMHKDRVIYHNQLATPRKQ
ncbi:carcinoembryonic antigen-related cell adhesion molecule 1-like [Hyperolius riggenbachi]|uniref:carcinoembryonic antigen-related cell adhesion molecule 1-like n=1 Tax=Hyperolius riggenbachi TaxID=752182 RepID=UPI0035A3527A